MIKNKILIATGGTGGHVFPALGLANYLVGKNFNVQLTTDKRGAKYLKENQNLKFTELNSSPLNKGSFSKFLLSIFIIFFSIVRSLLFLLFNRPSIIFGMGGYSSFPICIAASVLNIKFIIYENNLIIGKANKYLLPFAKKMFVSYKELEGVPEKFDNKVIQIGNLIREEIINIKTTNEINRFDSIKILVLGGSQAAKVFAKELPQIFKKIKETSFSLKVYQQCQNEQNDQLSQFYNEAGINYEIFNFTDKIIDYYSKSNLVITRAGASVLGELVNVKIPFIAIPLPTSADNHQHKNAEFYVKKGYGYLLEETNIKNKLYNLIISIFNDKSLLNNILSNQRQYSDKDIFNNLIVQIEKILNEKVNLGQKDIIHFVGIGGIGMSGLAQIMSNMGFRIQGSDQSKNKNTNSCSKSGIRIFIGHSAANVKNATILVKSTAIKKNNVELKYARKNKIPIYSRAEVLADAVSLKKIL